MAGKAFDIVLALALVAVLSARLASAQSGCTTVILSLAPCLSYISGNASAPSASCCSQLASVVQSNPACLCSILNGGASSFGITINQTRALAMPAACKVQTPPVSQCNAASPKKAPAASSPTTPLTPTTPAAPATPSTESPPSAESGSKATPATASGGSSYKSTHSLMLSIIFVAACISFTKL
ncbi:non-specific lipid-transfer protein-like protein [Canna indica]|uniref:Non-specific lipid-transfer protein-like protein n=1 Tax=Canna indica TaxID=4628 RepID=A0AAQ3Q5D4_9LILI|nr:non-specific lipid-transfer protein-like protein [Canna indica]